MIDAGTALALAILVGVPAVSSAAVFVAARAWQLTTSAATLLWLSGTAAGFWLWLGFLGPWSSSVGDPLLATALVSGAGVLVSLGARSDVL